MQGNPSLPMIFNIVVDMVVRVVLEDICGPQESHHSLGWAAGERCLLLYSNDGRITGRDLDWVKDSLLVMVDIFCMVGLETNLEKTKAMVFILGSIWGQIGKKAYKQRIKGEEATFQESKRTRVNC